jgi:hypothetical protein
MQSCGHPAHATLRVVKPRSARKVFFFEKKVTAQVEGRSEGKRTEKQFFFEKKSQKTFA